MAERGIADIASANQLPLPIPTAQGGNNHVGFHQTSQQPVGRRTTPAISGEVERPVSQLRKLQK